MANTIIPGDFIFVNLAAYKINTPFQIPILGIPINSVDLFKTGEPGINDLAALRFPPIESEFVLYNNSILVKRIIACPGDTLQIINKKIFVNESEITLPASAHRNFENINPGGKEDERIFFKGSGWNTDNYGPIVIPSKNDILKITVDNIDIWQHLIVYEYRKKVVRKEGSVITIDGNPVRDYIVQKDHYFVIGDNFDNSQDSRYFGFINEDMIIGKVIFIYWSLDPYNSEGSFFSSIRWGRIFKGL
jgi:signal peptidase I